jgi:hypothetical protein
MARLISRLTVTWDGLPCTLFSMSLTGTRSMWIEKAMFAFICVAVVLAVWQVFAR